MSVSSEQQRNRMLNEPAGKLLFHMALPTVITQLISVIYNTADTYFVAQINTQASAAVGIVFSLMAVIQAVGFGIGMGAGSLISRSLGAEKDEEAYKYANSALACGTAFGLLLLLFGLIFIHSFMRLLGASESVLPYANDYAVFILAAAPFMCAAFVLNNILKAEGQTMFSMIGMTTGGLLNIGLDPLFIFVFHMGIRGAAAATMISQIVGLLIMAGFFIRNKSIVKLHPGYISREPHVYMLIFRTGIPTIIRQGLASVATAILNNQAAPYGDSAVAAVSITGKLYMLGRNIILGLGQGYQPIAGYCYGAGSRQRVRKLFRIAVAAGTCILLIISVSIFVFRYHIMMWFRNDPEVIQIGANCLLYTSIALPFLAYPTYVNQTYQCLGFAGGATFLASCRQGIFFIPLAFILPGVLGITGIELVQSAADLLTFIISIPFHIWFFRRVLTE